MISAAFRASSVDQSRGIITDISLLQVGEAKGHGVYIDDKSLVTAETALGDTLPAYITHSDAYEDRLLSEVGYFKGFSVVDDKLKAQQFVALESFKRDDEQRYERLFDIANTIPENFGLSLVFNANLVWVLDNGKEISASIPEDAPENSVYGMPVVRFTEIRSADFVDTPAANADGLFSTQHITTDIVKQNQEDPANTGKLSVSEEIQEEQPLVETALEEVVESTETEETTETPDETTPLAALEAKYEALAETVDVIVSSLESLTALAETTARLSAVTQGVKPQPVAPEPTTPSIVDQFKNAQGRELSKLWKNNRSEIINQLNS